MTLDFDLSVWIISFIVLTIVLYLLWRRKRSLPYLFFFAIFWIYSMFVLKAILFPIPFGVGDQFMSGEVPYSFRVNLVPLDFQSFNSYRFIESLLNIFLTIPFGFGIHFIKAIRRWDYLWVFLLGGVALEVCQLMVGILINFPYRVFDINDIIMNFVGVLGGVVFFKIFGFVYKKFTKIYQQKYTGFLLFIQQVVDR